MKEILQWNIQVRMWRSWEQRVRVVEQQGCKGSGCGVKKEQVKSKEQSNGGDGKR